MHDHDQTFTREFSLDRTRINADRREVELSFSSELPVERHFGIEILDHSPGAVDLSRLNNGSGPLLWNHDPSELVGRVSKAWVSGDRKARASVRFGNSTRAKELWTDVQDGIIETVSVGYRILETRTEKKDGQEVYRAVKWQPLEISLVSVPADVGVGIHRSASREERNQRMKIEVAPTEEQKEIQAIAGILAKRGVEGVEELATRHLAAGSDIETFRTAAFKLLPNVQPIRAAEPLDIAPREWSRYSITKVLRAQIPGVGQKLDGFEAEMNQEYERKLGRRAEGAWVPREALAMQAVQGRNYVAGTGTLGGMLVQTDNLGSAFIELLRNRAKCVMLGARMINLSNPVTIPRQNAAGAVNWVGETVAATLSAGNFTQITLTPHGLSAFQQYGKQLLFESDPSIDSLIRDDILKSIATEIDRVVLHGAGGTEPTGITGTTGVTTIALGANGAAFSVANGRASMVSLETAIADANADSTSMAYMTNARVRGRMRMIDENQTTATASWLWKGNADGSGRVLDYRAEVSNQVSKIQTQGTATTICSSVFFGNWQDVLVGSFNNGATDMVVDPYTLAQNAVVRVIARHWLDLAVRHGQSFAVLLGVLDA